MDKILESLIWLGEQVKSYKGPFLGAGIASLITFLLTIWFNLNPYPAVLIPLLIASIFLAWWSLTTEKLYQILAKKLTRSRFKNPNIAILSVGDMDKAGTKDLLRSTVYTPEDWYNRFSSSNIRAEKINDLSMKTDYSIIINPFGELYPEEDTTNLKTFQKIEEYIKHGGVFVNTAGLAFWYMWNPKTELEGLTGPMVETYNGIVIWNPKTELEGLTGPKLQTYEGGAIIKSEIHLTPVVIPDNSSLTDTWLYKNFGIRTTLGDKRSLEVKNAAHFDIVIGESLEVQEFRSALRCEAAEAQLIPIIRSEYEYQPGRKHECYPIAAVKYGRGYLILNGMALTEEKDLLLVVKVIKNITERLRKEGSLEL